MKNLNLEFPTSAIIEYFLTLGRTWRAALKQSTALSNSPDKLNNTPRPIWKQTQKHIGHIQHAVHSILLETQIDQITNPKIHLFHIPQCSIQNRNVHISVLNGALWDMEQVHSGTCEIGVFKWTEFNFKNNFRNFFKCLPVNRHLLLLDVVERLWGKTAELLYEGTCKGRKGLTQWSLDDVAEILTHWPLGDLDVILKIQFSILFYWLVSSDALLIDNSLRWMPWDWW